MKSTTYIVEITNQKNEKYLYVGRNPVAWLPPSLLAYWKVFCRFWPIKLRDLSLWYRPLLFFWEFSSIIPFMAQL